MDRQKFKWQAQIIIISVLCFILCPVPSAEAKTFKVASYNVENLFDLNENGTEYTEYIPNNIFGWNTRTLDRKLNNIAKVIKDLSADVVALQEIESDKALMLLRNKLKTFNVDYPFAAIADSEHAAVQCALLSRFPVVSKEEICTNNAEARNILKITINVDGTPFLLFVNHWKSKRGPESETSRPARRWANIGNRFAASLGRRRKRHPFQLAVDYRLHQMHNRRLRDG